MSVVISFIFPPEFMNRIERIWEWFWFLWIKVMIKNYRQVSISHLSLLDAYDLWHTKIVVCTCLLTYKCTVKCIHIFENLIDTSPRHSSIQFLSNTWKPWRQYKVFYDTLQQGAYMLCTAVQCAISRLQHHRWEMRNFEGNWAQWIFTVDQHKVI